MNEKVIILLSGGLDSATTLYFAKEKGYICYCLTFDYGQRHKREIDAAIDIAKAAVSSIEIISFKMPWGGSSLLDETQDVPVKRDTFHNIPSTYVPGRNTIFLSFAVSFAETINASRIFIGANQIDYSGYPDCRSEYFEAWQGVIESGTKSGVEGNEIIVDAPLLHMKKEEIVKLGRELRVPFELTWSCYQGKDYPCRECDSCRFREEAFSKAGLYDPLLTK